MATVEYLNKSKAEQQEWKRKYAEYNKFMNVLYKAERFHDDVTVKSMLTLPLEVRIGE